MIAVLPGSFIGTKLAPTTSVNLENNRGGFMSLCAAKLQTDRESTNDHLIGEFIGHPAGSTLIVVGSIHGNEPAGEAALQIVSRRIEPLKNRLLGRVYLLAGNTRALRQRVRYIDSDLNRYWSVPNIVHNSDHAEGALSEDREQRELLKLFREILRTAKDEVYVLDLHSTSAGGWPFATVGDTLRNRAFAETLPVTILLGIEEQLEGTMLEFLNNEGAVTLGFEGGQHLSPKTTDNHVSLILQSVVSAHLVDPKHLPELNRQRHRLEEARGPNGVLEVRYREPVASQSGFLMKPGFRNFQPVKEGQFLATKGEDLVTAPETGLILMPLYQKQGEDGFFIVRKVAAFWLTLSGILRKLRIPDLMHWLPGVRRPQGHPETLIVNTSVARFFPLQIFHLLGFRRLRWEKHQLVVSRRRHDTVSPFRQPV